MNIQIDVSGIHSCGSPFFYSGKATVLRPVQGRDAFLLNRPVECANCGDKIEVYLAERSTERNISAVGTVSWHV